MKTLLEAEIEAFEICGLIALVIGVLLSLRVLA